MLDPPITKKKRKANPSKTRRPAVQKRNSKLPKRQRDVPPPKLPPQRVLSRQDFQRKHIERKQMSQMQRQMDPGHMQNDVIHNQKETRHRRDDSNIQRQEFHEEPMVPIYHFLCQLVSEFRNMNTIRSYQQLQPSFSWISDLSSF